MRAAAVILCVMVMTILWAPQGRADTLFEDLGGSDGIQAIVDGAARRWLADSRIAATFSETNMDRLRRLLTEQICQITDGPCRYSGRDMAAAHRALGLKQSQFNALAEDLQDSMSELGVGYHTQNRLMAKLAPMQRDVVTR